MAHAPFKIHKVRQYCYFWMASETVSAAEMAAAVGLEPDEFAVRGSLFADRAEEPRFVPVEHEWKIVSGEHGPIDDQVTAVLERVAPVADAVRSLVDQGDVNAGLMMVRYLDDDDGGYDAMGWALTREQIALIAAMGADVQADEYLDNSHPSAYGYDEA